MPKVKSLLKRIEVQVVKTKRTCKNSRTKMTTGEKCLVVWNAPRDYKPYCKEIALKMIKSAREKLDIIESKLEEQENNFNCLD